MGDSIRPSGVRQDDDEENRKGFVECGEMHFLVMNATVGLINQLVKNLIGSNVRET